MDELLKLWTATWDARENEARVIRLERDSTLAPILAEMRILQEALADIEGPYTERLAALDAQYLPRLADLEAEIRPLAIAYGRSYATNGVNVQFRKGYTKVSYDAGRVDTAVAILRGINLDVANALWLARKESQVQPSVKVERVQ